MTMRITVKNEDASRIATITPVDVSQDANFNRTDSKVRGTSQDLAPGESAEFWIHKSRDLEIVEKQ